MRRDLTICIFAAVVLAGAVRCTSPGGDAADTASGDPLAGECGAPKAEWIWCDDFETNRLSKYYEHATAGGRFVRERSAGKGGSYGMSARYNISESGAGSLKLAFGKTPDSYIRPVDAGRTVYREIYWRWYIMHPASWRGGGPDKMTRAISLVSSQWAEAMLAHVWGGSGDNNKLVIDPASGTDERGNLRTTVYNDFDRLRWLGKAGSKTNIFDTEHLGKWICVEAHARLNDAGQSNGVFELWIDGNAEAERTGLNWLGAYSAYGINAVFLENYWNNRSPVEQTRYWDNFVISTAPIGC